eukprot:906410-Prymnesium_polylepis.1
MATAGGQPKLSVAAAVAAVATEAVTVRPAAARFGPSAAAAASTVLGAAAQRPIPAASGRCPRPRRMIAQ